MEKADVRALLEKYWQTETTVAEEQALAAYFSSPSVDVELEPYRALFAYFEMESQVSPGPGFEARILQAIAAAGPTVVTLDPATTGTPGRNFRWGLVSAAATVLILVASLFLLQPVNPVRPATATPPATVARRVTDTYDDPEKALAAVRHALLIASVHLNEGRKQITNK
jgi:hypothetical protein